MFVVCSRLSGVGCQVLAIDLSVLLIVFTVSIVYAQEQK
jgi:hypothetical protein